MPCRSARLLCCNFQTRFCILDQGAKLVFGLVNVWRVYTTNIFFIVWARCVFGSCAIWPLTLRLPSSNPIMFCRSQQGAQWLQKIELCSFAGWALKNGPPVMQEKVRFSKFATLYGISLHQTNVFQSRLNSKKFILGAVYAQKRKSNGY